MYRDTSILAVVPARGGSKGLLDKNILECAGKPLIAWTIEAGLQVECIDSVVVSTDSRKIADKAIGAGAIYPFPRPEKFATDDASLVDAVAHVWENYNDKNGQRFDLIVILQPTSPIRNAQHIKNAIDFYFENRVYPEDTLASVYDAEEKMGWLMEKDNNQAYIHFCFDVETLNPQRQKLKHYYLPNGAIFIVPGKELSRGIYHGNTLPFLMNKNDSLDIDTLEDFKKADGRLALTNA